MSNALSFLIDNLPSALSYLVKDAKHPEELRLSLGAPVVLISTEKKEYSPILCTRELLEQTLSRLTEYSFYSHSETVKEGYLSLPYGIRAGVCGRAVCKGGSVTSIRDLSFLNVRIPSSVENAALPLYKKLCDRSFLDGVLLYSLPGVGKTTVLKDLIRLLSKKGLSLAIIDERGELSADAPPIDGAFYRHYPKAQAIVMAVKTARPQLMILDEISSVECPALLSAAACGVPVIASAHGRSSGEIRRRPGFEELFSQGLFPIQAGITRNGNNLIYSFSP